MPEQVSETPVNPTAPQPQEAAAPELAARPTTGLTFRVAESLEQALSAWRMVYMAYRRAGLIGPNPHRVHTAPQACGEHAAVIAACIGPVTVSTLTALADNPQGLPLDRVYGMELESLRRDGRVLMEVGLFADRRKQLNRTAEALFQLMRYAFYYGLRTKVTDFVIGVHPRHARFYTRAFGFETMGSARTYPAVNNRPVVLLRGDLETKLKLNPLHPALDYFVRNPVATELFDRRFDFSPHRFAGSDLQRFLSDLQSDHGLSATA
jgi:hypothetical protein